MSENETSKTAMQIASTLATDVYKDGVQPSVKTIGDTLAGIFKAIGHYPRYWGMMSDISLEYKQERFRKTLEAKVAEIPDDRKVLPKPYILGPSVQALEYGVLEDHLSDMFASLIASSMDADKSRHAHPSFVEIIKQMNADEAKLLSYISKNGGSFPIISLYANAASDGESLLQSVEIIVRRFSSISDKAGCQHPNLVEQMIDNLERLKLIEVELSGMGGELSDKSLYSTLISTLEEKHSIKVSERDGAGEAGGHFVMRGFFLLTAFGESFVRACLTNSISEGERNDPT